ncbi:MAG: hypothetical protein ABIN36_05875 [Ferruginibacter sp.]
MKTYAILSVLIFVSISFSASAQQQNSKSISRIQVNSLYVQTGFLLQGGADGTLADFNRLAPNSTLMGSNNLNNFFETRTSSVSVDGIFSVMLGLQFSNKQKQAYKANPLLRLGVSYFSGNTLTYRINNNESKTFDTLTSALTGETFYLDSSISKDYSMKYSLEQLRFDGSLIFRTNPESRCSLFAGIGFTVGYSLNAKTVIEYDYSSYQQVRSPGTNSVSAYGAYSSRYNGDNTKRERFKNKNNFGASVYIPLGFDFRLGRKRPFFKRIHLYYELRPGVNFTDIPELRKTTNASILSAFGLRVGLN